MTKSNKVKILVYDIETTPNLAYVWGKWQQDVVAFKKERELLSFAYSWVGDKRIHCETRRGKRDDRLLTTKLAKLLKQADIVVAHNGDQFDRKIVKARMLYWSLPPLPVNSSVDTKKVAKAYFNFNGNSLNDLCKYLKIGKKAHNPGFDMWVGCMKDDPKAWAQMIFYNKMDVMLLKKLYKRFLPWIENHPNLSLLLRGPEKLDKPLCPLCSSPKITKYGFRTTPNGIGQRWLCLGCGRNFVTRIKKGITK